MLTAAAAWVCMVHGRNVLELGKDGPDPERDGLDMRHNDLGVLQPALAVMLSGFCESLMILGTTCLPLKGLLPDVVVTIIIKSVDSFVRNVYSGRSIEFGIKTTISYSKLVRPLENSYDEDFFFFLLVAHCENLLLHTTAVGLLVLYIAMF